LTGRRHLLNIIGNEIRYTVASPSHVQPNIYDTKGAIVQRLVNGKQKAGAHAIQPDKNLRIAQGLYLCRMKTGNKVYSGKVLIK